MFTSDHIQPTCRITESRKNAQSCKTIMEVMPLRLVFTMMIVRDARDAMKPKRSGTFKAVFSITHSLKQSFSCPPRYLSVI